MMDGAHVSTGPLVVDTHELGRRPGTERTYELSVDAPANLGGDVYGVPEGSPIDIELRLDAVMDGVLATGTASAQVAGECVRCLIEIDGDFVVDFQELYLYADPSEEELALDGDLLDLEPVLRDAVVLTLPLNPVCDPECPGLCPECGVRLADDPDHTHQAAIDPRWQALGSALENLKE
jgi:uncharacterized protein